MNLHPKTTLLLFSSLRLLISGLPPVLGKPWGEFKMVHVITASKGVTNLEYFERNRAFFKREGYQCEELDLDGKSEAELRKILSGKELVYVEGGNSYYLLKSIRESGFDKVIKELLPKGLIYVGGSAGAYVCCPTIEMATWKHQDRNRFGVTDFTAMNLVPFLLSVHYKPEYRDLLKEKISHVKYPVKILTDEQALLIKDGEVELVGNQERVVLS